MILLNTNVISELMRPRPDPSVVSWLRKQSADRLHVTTLTVAEILRCLGLLPAGARRTRLEQAFQVFLDQGFDDRILPFSHQTARVYAPIYRSRVEAGLGVGELDLLIAAIAKEHGASLATRNTGDFEACGIRLINPWLGRDASP